MAFSSYPMACSSLQQVISSHRMPRARRAASFSKAEMALSVPGCRWLGIGNAVPRVTAAPRPWWSDRWNSSMLQRLLHGNRIIRISHLTAAQRVSLPRLIDHDLEHLFIVVLQKRAAGILPAVGTRPFRTRAELGMVPPLCRQDAGSTLPCHDVQVRPA